MNMEERVARSREIDETVMRLRREQRDLTKEINAELLANRPIYPTEEQLTGIAEACRRIRDEVKASSHHGDPCGNYAVVADGARGFISVRLGDRYGAGQVGPLWHFEDAEIETILQRVRDEGMEIRDHWKHGDGVSILASPKP